MKDWDFGITAAARSEGKHPKTLRRWVITGEAERQKEKYDRWIKDNPERAKALRRKSSAKQRRDHPERVRAARRRASRKRRVVCTVCGGLAGIDAMKTTICLPCRMEAAELKYRQLEQLWKEGATLIEIAELLGYSTRNSLSQIMFDLRKKGYDLPFRRKP